MSKASGLPQVDMQQREKLKYEEVLGYYKPRKPKVTKGAAVDEASGNKAVEEP
jgi:hypothetical protein